MREQFTARIEEAFASVGAALHGAGYLVANDMRRMDFVVAVVVNPNIAPTYATRVHLQKQLRLPMAGHLYFLDIDLLGSFKDCCFHVLTSFSFASVLDRELSRASCGAVREAW